MSQQDNICGIQELWRPKIGDPEVDIVAVHGLNGHARQTWTNSNGICWLDDQDFLPNYIKNARVVVWGYNATYSSLLGNDASKQYIHHHATSLVSHLSMDRRLARSTKRPIIFLCHSIGGLIVKKALSYSETRKGPKTSHEYDIFASTSAILFFGTPHLGSSQASLLSYLQRVSSLSNPFSKSRSKAALAAALEREAESIQEINLGFVHMMKRFNIFFFWENEKTDLPGIGKDYVVNNDSAAPVITAADTERSGIAANHADMVKFKNNYHPDFRMVMEALLRYSEQAVEDMAMKQQHATKALENDWELNMMEYMRPRY